MDRFSRTFLSRVLSFVFLLASTFAWAAEPVEVPKLTGEKINIAKQVATVADLKPTVGIYFIASQNWRNDIRTDVVSMQTPQPGTLVPAGTRVGMWKFVKAAVDRELVDVPDLRGKTNEEVSQTLERLGLTSFGAGEDAKTQPILDQYPEPGTKAFIGTSIFITLRQ